MCSFELFSDNFYYLCTKKVSKNSQRSKSPRLSDFSPLVLNSEKIIKTYWLHEKIIFNIVAPFRSISD